MGFSLDSYPVVYRAKYAGKAWSEEYLEKSHKTPEEEAGMSEGDYAKLSESRNFYDDMPLVSYTTQYGLGCFEGLKALPQKDGGLAIFRPDRNGERFFNSMEGLMMPGFPADMFVKACVETVKRNAGLGFRPHYKSEWEKDSFMNADSVYMRPFSYSEGGVGVSLSKAPWVIIVTTPVSSYFSGGKSEAVVTERIRATPKGTGWIKAASNYVISALAREEAHKGGFMECVFLDATDRKYFEEGSSSNIFFYLKSGELVTPELGDTILPGITRSSIIELARDINVKTSERKISVDEVFADGAECFVTGTAAGVTPIESLTYNGKKIVFNNGKVGDLSAKLRDTLKGIQYGVLEDTKGWMVKVV
ncbi:branched-chain-amino-acid transaminase [Breznakiella homolactica]|uniref:Branched-chain-amino-acid aminotransferase n=1 Tax=Breznakiella homolactica TaxID=2798577 RepID=A0A7T8B8U2_9SPIR|nr:branched-chain-amino-acid transaminase [Breznakiella homolactica]QQO08974.1 branched-chain-amino-acid transaminase [Breznakiella homolactica]